MLRWAPLEHALRRVLRQPAPSFAAVADERWEIAPATRRWVPPARFLPGQLERIQATEFGDRDSVVRDLTGGFEAEDAPTLGLLHRHVDLVDGVLYAAQARQPLRPRLQRGLAFRPPAERRSGALCETWIGNRWFGSWLSVDCLSYALSEPHGVPFTTRPPPPPGHRAEYESLLGQQPLHVQQVHFDELVTFEDSSQNRHKQARALAMRARLIAALPQPPAEHAGVYLWRGHAGDKRLLLNEQAVADHLATRHGFSIVDPLQVPVLELVRQCAGARVVAGVEGSQLCHALAVMAAGTALFVIQPPQRVVSVLKAYTDRQDQTFAFIVATGGNDQFSVDLDEVDRTLELALR